jgi:hypothetical protein
MGGVTVNVTATDEQNVAYISMVHSLFLITIIVYWFLVRVLRV